jgi:predicted nucleotidyltransferase
MTKVSEGSASLCARVELSFRDAAPSGVVSVYLFGSHAQGRAHRESDVDVGVLLSHALCRTPADRFVQRVRLTTMLMGALHTNALDVVVLNDAPPLLARHIVTAGRRVYCTDDAADRAFVRDVQLRAADIEPFLRRTRRIKLAALAR